LTASATQNVGEVRQWGLTSIHTCRSYVHTPCDVPRKTHL